MTRRGVRPLAGLAIAALSFYVVYGLLLYVAQARMLFPAPSSTSPALLSASAIEAGATEVKLPGGGYAWHRGQGGRRLVIYAHGNGEDVSSRPSLHRHLASHGWDTLAVTYPGYPGASGTPSEAAIEAMMREVWTHATVTLGVPVERVVLHGYSLGGGAVGTIVDEVTPGGIVFESTFASVWDIARRRAPIYPLSLMLESPFLTIERAPSIRVPTLVLHGRHDRVVPVEHGRRLSAAVPGAVYLEVSGGHAPGPIRDGTEALVAYDALLNRVAP